APAPAAPFLLVDGAPLRRERAVPLPGGLALPLRLELAPRCLLSPAPGPLLAPSRRELPPRGARVVPAPQAPCGSLRPCSLQPPPAVDPAPPVCNPKQQCQIPVSHRDRSAGPTRAAQDEHGPLRRGA